VTQKQPWFLSQGTGAVCRELLLRQKNRAHFAALESMMATRPQKTAKFAILSPGHAGFPNRVKRSEGSDTTPTSHVQKVLRTE